MNGEAELSPFTASALRRLSGRGVHIGVATARTQATVSKLIEGTGIAAPLILMNGVCVFDPAAEKYLKINSIPEAEKESLFSAVSACGGSGFLYVINGGVLKTYYENTLQPNAAAFIEERERKYGKRFERVDSLKSLWNENIVYYSISDKKEKLAAVYEFIKTRPGMSVEFYADNYSKANWYFEICAAAASKFNALQFVRNKGGYDKVISFGDNLNDLSMFEASDECYAVENAKAEVKARANAVIGSNLQDAVVKKIAEMENVDL